MRSVWSDRLSACRRESECTVRQAESLSLQERVAHSRGHGCHDGVHAAFPGIRALPELRSPAARRHALEAWTARNRGADAFMQPMERVSAMDARMHPWHGVRARDPLRARTRSLHARVRVACRMHTLIGCARTTHVPYAFVRWVYACDSLLACVRSLHAFMHTWHARTRRSSRMQVLVARTRALQGTANG